MKKSMFLQIAIVMVTGVFALMCAQKDNEPREVWDPEPRVIVPGEGTAPPSDAIVLFDGTNFSQWEHKDGKPVQWKLENGAMTVVDETGSIRTKQGFGDCQLHVEWRTPAKGEGKGQGRGNSGIFLQSRYELQVLDSYENRTYSNGQAASIYKQHMPLVNACREPGQWQTYDIIYTAPRFNDRNELVSPAYMTVLQNNVLVQHHSEIQGGTSTSTTPKYKAHDTKEPIVLQDHSNPVSYRNIWIREL